MPFFGRSRKQRAPKPPPPNGLAPTYDGNNAPIYGQMQHQQPVPDVGRKRVYRQSGLGDVMPRVAMASFTIFCLVVTVIFLIMVEIGNTYDHVVLRDIWFLKMQFVNISPASNSTPGLGFGIAEALDFYDFYQIGLWNYCQGNNGSGIASCTHPSSKYWFDPIALFTNQLDDAQVTLPSDFYDSLKIIRVSSHWMFGLFMTGACLSFVLIPISWSSVKSRWTSLGLSIITFLNAIIILAAAVIATVLYVLLRDLLRDYQEIINLVPTLGGEMFALMWIAAAFAIIAFLVQCVLSCCCTSQRDIRKGRRHGRKRTRARTRV